MARSTSMFFLAAATGVPAWFVDVNALPTSVKAAWLAIMATCAIGAFYLWIKDGK